jgi:hypothetical protein
MPHSRHPEQTKAKARQVYEQAGSAAAHQATGVPIRTIREWAKLEHWHTTVSAAAALEATHQHAAATRIGWGARKRALGDEAGQAAAEALTMFRERVQARKVYGLEPLARSFAMLTERADAMTAGTGGEAGRDIPQAEALARVRELATVLTQRREAAGDA